MKVMRRSAYIRPVNYINYLPDHMNQMTYSNVPDKCMKNIHSSAENSSHLKIASKKRLLKLS